MGIRRIEPASLSSLRRREGSWGTGGTLKGTAGGAEGPSLQAPGQELVSFLPPPAGCLSPSNFFFFPKPKGIPNKATADV